MSRFAAIALCALGVLLLAAAAVGLYNRSSLDAREWLLVAFALAGVALLAFGFRDLLPKRR